MSGTQKRALLVGLLATFVAVGAIACGDEEGDEETTGNTGETSGGEPEEPPEPVDEESQQARQALAKMRVHLDLLALSHLADVDHHGLYIDLGTAARMHHTMGRWHSGFLSDVTADERDFTRIGTNARAWFHVDEAGPLTLRFRGRPQGSDVVVVYLNGQPAGQIDFEGTSVQNVDVAVEERLVRAGENALMLRSARTRAVQGEEVSAELDSIWVMRSPPEGEIEPPRYTTLVRELEVGGESRRAVILRGPSTIRWYAEVPVDGRLSFGFGGADEGERALRVTVTPEDGEAAVLHEGPVGPEWGDRLIDLSSHAGDVVRIEFAVTGDGEVGISGPAVVVPMPEEALASAEARSVIVLLIDTLRASKLRPYNPRSRVETPALSAFAEEGAVFEHAQSPENWTKPSVASVLTSLTPMTHNTKEDGSTLPQSALTLAEVFQRNDFETGSFIANGFVSRRYGFDQGWDHYTNYIREERNTSAENVFREAAAWIEEHREERFFAYIQTIDPHVPYDPPNDILAHYDPGEYTGPIQNRRTAYHLADAKSGALTLTARDRRRLEGLHDAEIDYHDRQMTTFIARLRELGVYDDVIFVVTSDHGEEFNDHGSWGHGHSIFQELLHVPLMFRWNGVIDPLRVSPTVSTLDIAPTVLEAAGIEIPDEFEGHSLLSTARGRMRAGPSIAFSDKLDDRRVATAAGYKLIVRGNLTWAFFNLREDPREQNQIESGSRHPIALRYLRGLYGQHLGAEDRGDWLHAGTGGTSRTLPSSSVVVDPELCAQLVAMGYVAPAGCGGDS